MSPQIGTARPAFEKLIDRFADQCRFRGPSGTRPSLQPTVLIIVQVDLGSRKEAEDGNRTRHGAAQPPAGEIRLGPRTGIEPCRPGFPRPTGFEVLGGHPD